MEQTPTRDGFLALLGECPEKQPSLDIEVLSERDLESHTLKLVEYAAAHEESC